MYEILVEKNEEKELPVPHIWRPTFKAIANAFVEKDYSLKSEIRERDNEYIIDIKSVLVP
ncbi:hypothetical protein BTO06_11750 [Tenacibaculum sp. SZ-18]|uniref:hypothetical protein n=1 Tax=Tenacibaculum sp. SZ-18 TaxID=754423 RepID=UPI000C2D4A80|nr:hypothetical protein [Tenacibaculum sp. SZ-18]AUC15781.1 hypothetical protein BTO06_11750 [Tenacibaculum sp. SZ-18]